MDHGGGRFSAFNLDIQPLDLGLDMGRQGFVERFLAGETSGQ